MNSKNMSINVECHCPFCGATHFVNNVDPVGYLSWEMGELIQKALPNLSPTEREQMISGLCPECQKKIFGE